MYILCTFDCYFGVRWRARLLRTLIVASLFRMRKEGVGGVLDIMHGHSRATIDRRIPATLRREVDGRGGGEGGGGTHLLLALVI